MLNQQGVNGYAEITEEGLNELNRRVRVHAHEYFIVNSNTTKDIWFQKLELPDDAWENANSGIDPTEHS
jgi:hypothetical protein